MENAIVGILGSTIESGSLLTIFMFVYMFPIIAYLLTFFKLSKVIDKNTDTLDELKIIILQNKE